MRARLGIALGLAVVVGLSACASGGGGGGGGPAATAGYGFMIPGNRLASAFGISPTDTVYEIQPRTTLPNPVTNARRRYQEQQGWAGCTRSFGGPDKYFVIFYRSCSMNDAMYENRSVVGFASDGTQLGQVNWTGPNTVTLLVPEHRG